MSGDEQTLAAFIVIFCGTGLSTATFIALHLFFEYARRRGAGVSLERWQEKGSKGKT